MRKVFSLFILVAILIPTPLSAAKYQKPSWLKNIRDPWVKMSLERHEERRLWRQARSGDKHLSPWMRWKAGIQKEKQLYLSEKQKAKERGIASQ